MGGPPKVVIDERLLDYQELLSKAPKVVFNGRWLEHKEWVFAPEVEFDGGC